MERETGKRWPFCYSTSSSTGAATPTGERKGGPFCYYRHAGGFTAANFTTAWFTLLDRRGVTAKNLISAAASLIDHGADVNRMIAGGHACRGSDQEFRPPTSCGLYTSCQTTRWAPRAGTWHPEMHSSNVPRKTLPQSGLELVSNLTGAISRHCF